MAEDPVFSGFSVGDAASSFASVVSGIRQDMAAIERSAKNIERSLERASRANIGGGGSFGAQNAGGGTGYAKDTGISLGQITRATAFVGGGLYGMATGGGFLSGGVAAAALPDLRVTPQQAGNFESARFGTMQATGSFESFQRILDNAQTDFNVQSQTQFMNTVVAGTQRMGMVGMMGGGTVGERRAGGLIGGINSMAGLAGIDQSAVPGMMNSIYGAPAYYSALASGIQLRNPVTGELASTESITNQMWNRNAGILGGMSEQDQLTWIDRQYGIGTAGRAELTNMFGGDEAAVQTFIEGMRLRAQSGGEALKEGQIEEAAEEAGILGTDKTQQLEAERRGESERLGLTGEYVDKVTEGVAEAANLLSDAVEQLAELDGPLRTIVDAFHKYAAEFDTFQTEVPGMTKGVTEWFTKLPDLLTGLVTGIVARSLLSKLGIKLPSAGGAVKTIAQTAGRFLGLSAGAAGAVVTGVAAAGYLTYKYGDREAHKAMGTDPDKRPSYLTGNTGTGSSSDYSYTGGYAEGDWFISKDQDAKVHYGEMVLPNRVAQAVRDELALGQTSGPISNRSAPKRGGDTTVNIYLTVQRATDSEAQHFASRVKRIIDDDSELEHIGIGSF